MTGRIVEGSTVEVQRDGGWVEALACGPVEDGDVLVRFTTGRDAVEHMYAASRVRWVADPW